MLKDDPRWLQPFPCYIFVKGFLEIRPKPTLVSDGRNSPIQGKVPKVLDPGILAMGILATRSGRMPSSLPFNVTCEGSSRSTLYTTIVVRTKILHVHGLTRSVAFVQGVRSQNMNAAPQEVWPKGSSYKYVGFDNGFTINIDSFQTGSGQTGSSEVPRFTIIFVHGKMYGICGQLYGMCDNMFGTRGNMYVLEQAWPHAWHAWRLCKDK